MFIYYTTPRVGLYERGEFATNNIINESTNFIINFYKNKYPGYVIPYYLVRTI